MQVLVRSLLVLEHNIGNQSPRYMVTRRGRAALDSADPAAFIDLPGR
jgi:hypothetical protein